MSIVIFIAFVLMVLNINEIIFDLYQDSIKYPVYVYYPSWECKRMAYLKMFFNMNKSMNVRRIKLWDQEAEYAYSELQEQAMMDTIQNEFEFKLIDGLDLELSQSDDGVLVHTAFSTQQISLRGLYMGQMIDRLKKGARQMLYGEMNNQGVDLTDWDRVFEL